MWLDGFFAAICTAKISVAAFLLADLGSVFFEFSEKLCGQKFTGQTTPCTSITNLGAPKSIKTTFLGQTEHRTGAQF